MDVRSSLCSLLFLFLFYFSLSFSLCLHRIGEIGNGNETCNLNFLGNGVEDFASKQQLMAVTTAGGNVSQSSDRFHSVQRNFSPADTRKSVHAAAPCMLFIQMRFMSNRYQGFGLRFLVEAINHHPSSMVVLSVCLRLGMTFTMESSLVGHEGGLAVLALRLAAEYAIRWHE